MKFKVLDVKEQSDKGNKGYKFTLENAGNKNQQIQYIEPRNARALRDSLELEQISDLIGMTIELTEKKK